MERKNIFSINLDDQSVIDNEAFVLRRESAELAEKREKLSDELSKAIKKTIQKSLLRMLPTFIGCGLSVILGFVAFQIAESKEQFPIALGITAGVLFVIGVVYAIINNRKTKSQEDEPDEDLARVDDAYGELNAQVKKDLKVPEGAPEVEVFTHMYSLDDKKKKLVYSNDTATAFIEDDKLCFWYGEAVVGFPMNAIEALVKVNESITFDSWMSDDPHDSLKYMQYGIEKKEIDCDEEYTMKGYYSLHLTHEGQPFEMMFPLFDAEKFLELLNLEITEE